MLNRTNLPDTAVMRLLSTCLGAVIGAGVGAIIGGLGYGLQDAMGPDHYLVFGPAPGLVILLGVVVVGFLGGTVGAVVGIGLFKKWTGGILGLIFGVGAVAWQAHNLASAGLPPLDDTIIVSTYLLGLPLVGMIASIVTARVRSLRSAQPPK